MNNDQQRVRLRFFTPGSPEYFAISWASDRKDYVSGDCRVRAYDDDGQAGNDRTESMTLDEARAHIAANQQKLGLQIHFCVGLMLYGEKGEFLRHVDFAVPISVLSPR